MGHSWQSFWAEAVSPRAWDSGGQDGVAQYDRAADEDLGLEAAPMRKAPERQPGQLGQMTTGLKGPDPAETGVAHAGLPPHQVI